MAKNLGSGCLVAMQTEGFLPPLYFLHHVIGDVLIYAPIAECFVPERPIFGIQSPAELADSAERCTLESLASRYIKEILEQQSTGPFHLAGFSSGATLAFEMAKQLAEAGHRVGLLALIDAAANAPGPQLMQSPSTSGGALPLEQILHLADAIYRPAPYSGSALLLRFHDEAWAFGPDPLMGWSSLVQSRLAVIDFPGGHITGMEPSRARRLADILKGQMAQHEAQNVAK